MTKRILFLVAFVAGFLGQAWGVRAESVDWPQPKSGFSWKNFGAIPVLDKGRQKPFDTFARETVRTVTGREKFAGFEATELILSWMTEAPKWEKLPFLSLGFKPLQDYLKITPTNRRVSPEQIKANTEFPLLIQSIAAKPQGEKLSELERQAASLNERLNLFYKIAEGSSINLFPRKEGGWESLASLAQRFPAISLRETAPSPDAKTAAGVQGLLTSYHEGNTGLFHDISVLVQGVLRAEGEKIQNYPSESTLQRELHFNELRPFHVAWMVYAGAFFLLTLSLFSRGKALYGVGMLLLLAAFGIHSYGFVLRILISGRAPVTNMYETVLWVPFGMVLFAIILEAIFRARYYAVAAAGLASLALILADSAPGILDPSIHPLVPVLRDNFWLTVHVLTITLSYGAYTLALGIANINLGFYLFRPDRSDRIARLNQFTYRAIQIGVVFLAAGTILGGVWANSSWGRFWGWDPKEVWALIALLGYLAILHGRYAGWIRGFGLTVGAIIAYLLVVMAWYGVNFILGVGLHSYGFSSGGATFMGIFVLVEALWILFATLRFKTLKPRTSK